jgi:predicted dehydrogenase
MIALRIGLIGAGKHGSRYARHIVVDLPEELRLVALWRRDRVAGEAAARHYGCRYTPDIHAIVTAPDVDAVAIVVPPTLHAEICEAAAANGKAILLEKPVATSREDAERISAALARNRVPFMAAHTLRFNTTVRAVRDRILDIAPLHTIFLSQRFEQSPLVWLDQPTISGGGIILHTGVHSFDLLRFFTGAEAESAFCRAWRAHTRNTEDNFIAHIAFFGGVNATVMGSRSTESRNGLIEVAGARGQLVADHFHQFAYLIRGSIRTPIPTEPAVPTVRETLQAFARAVHNGTPPPISWQDGRAAVAIAHACYRSLGLGRPVPVAS